MSRFGLSDSEYNFLHIHLITPFQKKNAKLWLFGSRARGEHRPLSDIDIMVESSEDLSSEISNIQEFFSKSNFPFKVDLVREADFAESYRAGYLKDRQLLNS